jgi:hypothetical protein
MASSSALGYSFTEGMILAVITLFIGWQTVSHNLSFTALIWIILPFLSYAITFASLAAINHIKCGTINFTLVGTSSIFTLGAVIFFLILSYFSFFQNFIIPVVPVNLQPAYGAIIATAFFMFWAGLYGNAFGYGFVQACP